MQKREIQFLFELNFSEISKIHKREKTGVKIGAKFRLGKKGIAIE